MIRLETRTSEKVELIDVTARIEAAIREAFVDEGLCVVTVPHTTAGILINENADPSVAQDIIAALDRMAPEDLPYRHLEGNSPAHIKASLIGSSVSIIVEGGKLRLGRWQGVFFSEFDGPRRRDLWVTVVKA